MTNEELRVKALAKVKDKNFPVLSAVAYAIGAVTLIFADVTGIVALDIAIAMILGFATGLIACSGYAKVGMDMWRHKQGDFPELFSCYKSLETMKRGALPAATYALMLVVLRYGVLSGVWYVALIAGVVCVLLQMMAFWGAYMTEMEDGECPVKTYARGVKLAWKNIGRIIGMKVYVYWWMAGIVGVAVWLCISNELPPVMSGLIVFLLGFVLRWMIGAFIALAEAGVAREAYRG